MIRHAVHNNHGLFSSYFLDHQMSTQREWGQSDYGALFRKIRELYEREKEFLTPGLTESQLEERFFRPIFRELGFVFEVQEEAETSPDFPDYAFFKDRGDLDLAHRGTTQFYEKSIAIGEVKKWDTELDRFGRDRQNKRRNPSFQVWLYLQEVKPQWGILTNGRTWRLYRKDRLFDTFYEVDLVNIIESGDIDAFKYFCYFFRKESFFPVGDSTAFLNRIFEASEDYARGIGENLKENVYKAIRVISAGFAFRPQNGLDPRNETELRLIQENSMRLVYRILFILYAEARGLLNHPSYRESDYSLYTMKHEIARKKDSGQPILPSGGGYWARISDLFRLISVGSEEFGIPRSMFFVPPYDGGLFEPTGNEFLESKMLGDRALADAIDLLARTPSAGQRAGFIDYSTLEIRHLGSIYEGLLEYRLQVADEEMVAVGQKRLLWKRYSEYVKENKKPKRFEAFPEENRVSKGEVYVGTHRGERKATGSYYTPEPVVRFIVENTVGRILDERWRAASEAEKSVRDDILTLRILDPAMGSGHFLVGAVEFLAASLMKAIEFDSERGLYPEPSTENYTLDEARREVLAHCVYGVDMNELAVELAKVSLWLMTISKDKPLSFLDHHLKCGNSLIGASIEDVPWLPGERPKGVTTRIDKTTSLLERLGTKLEELESVSDDAIDDIRRKEELFHKLLESSDYKRIRLLADVHVGLWFTPQNQASKSGYGNLVDLVYSNEGQVSIPETMKWAVEASLEASRRQAFHWELEFPEVFLKRTDVDTGGGFDVVLGNPPYVSFGLGRVGKLDESLEAYLRSAFPSSAEYKISMYALFMELATRLTHQGGFQGLILPDSFLIGRYFSKIRDLILSQRLLRLVHFDKDFWESGDVGFPVIWTGQKADCEPTFIASFVESLEKLSAGEIVDREIGVSQPLSNRRKRIRLIKDDKTASLITQIETADNVVGDYLSLHHGIRSKVGREKVIAKSPPEGDQRWKKGLVESNQVTRYHLDYRGDHILVDSDLLFSGGWNPSNIEAPKLLIRRTGDSIISCVDLDGYYHTNAIIYGNVMNSERVALRILCGVLIQSCSRITTEQ